MHNMLSYKMLLYLKLSDNVLSDLYITLSDKIKSDPPHVTSYFAVHVVPLSNTILFYNILSVRWHLITNYIRRPFSDHTDCIML
jgi:hypothetical protein